ncbi:MAG TPA: DUF2304 domain-containing protein [Anaerolineaceae bacterium]|nr:DUF2304 domain-containing protein [Anaerolineaceae bacterium]HPN50902.1 DUF2304 domain-containing protein [Anaerolineaceae bacterium]
MNITIGQIVLLIGLLLFVFYFFLWRSILFDRMVYLLGTAAGIIFVIYPDLTTKIANMIGIGRGADLLLYFFVMYGMFFVISSSAHSRKAEHQLTELVRGIAVTHPVKVQKDADEGIPPKM